MGILSWLTGGPNTTAPGTTGAALASPWSEGLPSNIIVNDIFGTAGLAITRAEAMSIPAVAKARHLICSTLARQPLKVYSGAEELADQPAWLYRTSGAVPPQMRMVWVLDDLFFHGWSLLAVERGSRGQILDAVRVGTDRWQFDTNGAVLVDNAPVNADDVILIPGPYEGLLVAGARTIRGALDLEAVWAARVRNPIPSVEIHNTDANDPLTPEQAQALVSGYAESRKNINGAITYTPANVELIMHGDAATDLFVEGRNAIAIDIARLTGVPAAMLDASQVAASLTYNTVEGARDNFIGQVLDMWATPIEAQFSMDAVTPRGTRIAFDKANLTTFPQPSTGPATED